MRYLEMFFGAFALGWLVAKARNYSERRAEQRRVSHAFVRFLRDRHIEWPKADGKA